LLFPLVWGIASSYESQPRAIPFLVDIERGITRMARLFFRTKKAIDQKNITSTMTFRVGDKGGGDQASAK
jgi:hypothetical protein